MPTVWDETVVIPQSSIGRLAGFARRAGERWYLFITSGDKDSGLNIGNLPLSFLGPGQYDATLIADGTKTSFARQQRPGVRRNDTLNISLLPGGGFVAVFAPAAVLSMPVLQGFSSIPPANTNDGWVAGYSMLRDHADLVSHSFQQGVPWPEALVSSDYRTYSQHLRSQWEVLKAADDAVLPGRARYLMINPIATIDYASLAPYWGATDWMPLPSPWDQYQFNDPHVKTALVNYISAAVDFFHPAYLAIGIESNILLANMTAKWPAYKELNAYVYAAIKQRYPNLTVLASFHYEHMLGLTSESRTLADQLRDSYPNVLESEVVSLMQSSDLVAISSYPYMIEKNRYIAQDGRVDADYYDRAYAIAGQVHKPIAFEQTGYISRDLFVADRGVTLPGSEDRQNAFLSFVLHEAHVHGARFLVNFVAIDYGTTYGLFPSSLTWAYTGLLRQDLTAKPALGSWDAYRTAAGPATPAGSASPTFAGLTSSIQAAMQTTGVWPSDWPAADLRANWTPELFVRWQQFDSLTPGFSTYSATAADPINPLGLGDPFGGAIHATADRRARLMPYLTSLADLAAATGTPVVAAPAVYFPQDTAPAGLDPAFMLGPSLLVAPVVQEDATSRWVHLPAGAQWFDWYSGEAFTGGQTILAPAPLDRIPLFVRGGAILPTYSLDSALTPLQIDFYAGPIAQFTLVQPAAGGSSPVRSRVTWFGGGIGGGAARGVALEPLGASAGVPATGWRIALHQFTAPPVAVIADGVSLSAASSPGAFDASPAGWFYRAADDVLLVRFPGSAGSSTLFVQP